MSAPLSQSSSSASSDFEELPSKMLPNIEEIVKNTSLDWKDDKSPIPVDQRGSTLCLVGNAQYNGKRYTTVRSNSSLRSEFKKENKTEVSKIQKEATIKILVKKSGLNFLIVMGCTIPLGALGGGLGVLGGPVGIASGTIAGVAGGLLISSAIIAKRVVKEIKINIDLSTYYKSWRTQALISKSLSVFKNFLDIDKKFEKFMCPITYDFITVPVKGLDGKTYENESILEHLRLSKSKKESDENYTRSPIRGADFGEEDLVFDMQYFPKLMRKANRVYEEVKKISNNSINKYGMKAVVENTRRAMQAIHASVSSALWNHYVIENKKSHQEIACIIQQACIQWDFRALK